MRPIPAMMIATLLLAGMPAAGAWSATGSAKQGAVPRLSNGKPDLSGHWAEPYVPNMAARDRQGRPTVLDPVTRQPLVFDRLGEPLPEARASAAGPGARTFDLPYTEWGLQRWKDYDPVNDGDYAGNCLPFGLSRNINSPHGLQIVQSSDAVALLFEQNTWFHWVPTNGMKWPADLPPSWSGVSRGHWEGDTLVVETSGFNGYTRLDTAGHPHSRELILTNTFRRVNAATILHTVMVHDPKTYTRDWMNARIWTLRQYPDVILEYSCEESNLDNMINGTIKRWKPPADEE